MKASIKRVKGTTEHLVGGHTCRDAARLEVEESENGFLLVRYAKDGEFVGDTFHVSIDDLKRQAELEYELDGNWT